MVNWKERVLQEENRLELINGLREQGVLANASKQKAEKEVLEQGEGKRVLGLIQKLQVEEALKGIRTQIWGGLGEIEQGRGSFILYYDYNSNNVEVEWKTERRFGRHTEHRTGGYVDQGGNYVEPGMPETHIGWYDEKKITTRKTPTIKRTELSVIGYFSEKKDYYGLRIVDNEVVIPLKHFSKYEANHLTFEEIHKGHVVDYASWEHYPTLVSENGYVLFDLDSRERQLASMTHSNRPQTGDVTLLFPRKSFDVDRVKDFFTTALTVSSLQRTRQGKLPANLEHIK